jgi:RNA-binding protein NOB1
MDPNRPRVNALVLDAGPLLSLSPLRGLSKEYYTVPQVLGELKDETARSHFENLGLSAGVQVKVLSPDATALAKGKIDQNQITPFIRYFIVVLAELN